MSLLLIDIFKNTQMFINIILTIFTVYFTCIALFSLMKDKEYKKVNPLKRFAILVAARNEEVVLPNLIESLKNQTYPSDLYDIVIIPNNCSDNTEKIALENGAKVFNCPLPVSSKGDALNQYFDSIIKNPNNYDAFCIFDADNIVNHDYLERVNDALCNGVKVGQGYRESKNPTDTVISGSYSIYYYMIDRFYNRARAVLDISCLINGSGFVVSREIIEKFNGWHTKTMTEDIEFSTLCVLAGEKVQWIPDAKFFDEQPLTFEQSWKQRKRWTTGCIQGLQTYGWRLLVSSIKNRCRSSLDFLMFYLTPCIQGLCFVSFVLMVNTSVLYLKVEMYDKIHVFIYLWYLFIFISIGVLTSTAALKLENKDYKKMTKSLFYFWFFIVSWVPINVICLFKKQTVWHPIEHTRAVTINEISNLI